LDIGEKLREREVANMLCKQSQESRVDLIPFSVNVREMFRNDGTLFAVLKIPVGCCKVLKAVKGKIYR
jgi:hypothetical protein